MIKLVFLMRRKAGLSRETFFDYWLNEHPKLVLRHAQKLGIRRYVQSHALTAGAADALRPEWTDPHDWDGLAEVWLDSVDVVHASRGNPEMDAIQAELLRDEAKFVDLAASKLIVTQEHEIIGG